MRNTKLQIDFQSIPKESYIKSVVRIPFRHTNQLGSGIRTHTS